MKKRAVLFCIIFCLLCSGCAAERQTIVEHLENRESSFSVFSPNPEAEITELLTNRPALQVFLNHITISTGFLRSKLYVQYSDSEISESEVGIANDEKQLAEVLEEQLNRCTDAGAIVLCGQRDKEPDIAALRTDIEKSNYLATMGITAINCSFSSNNFTDDYIMEYQLEYMDSSEKVADARDKVRKKIDELAKEVLAEDDFTTVKNIHDYIINRTSYNEKDDDLMTNHTPFGVLFKQKGVCDGYTYTAKLLLDAAKIENYVVEGTAEGESHVWNMVKLGESYYHMDITWDDPIDVTGQNHLLYDYFLLDDSTMAEDHAWEKKSVPAAEKKYEKNT